jgi:uncharacterized membrane protein
MAAPWETHLARWHDAQLLDDAQAQAIRAFERSHQRAQGLSWPVLVALAMGALMLGAGVLLFVAAHWDAMSPTARFGLVLLLVAVFHVAAAGVAQRFAAMSVALHAVGTVALGAGIFLSGQIFHLQTNWYSGFLLWGAGAALGYGLLRQWPQAVLAAALLPVWCFGEWQAHTSWHDEGVLACGALMLALTYVSSARSAHPTFTQVGIGWLGGLALLPATFMAVVMSADSLRLGDAAAATPDATSSINIWWSWALALGVPLLLAAASRGKHVWANGVAALWVLGLYGLSVNGAWASHGFEVGLPVYAWCLLGALGLVAWGVKEGHKARVNLGVAMFGLTVLAFYFSSLMDKLGRSLSLVGLGILFLLGGWALEKWRRSLMARMGDQP